MSNIEARSKPLLDKGYVELLDVMPSPETQDNGLMLADMAIVNAARISYNHDTKGATKDIKLIHYLMKHRHMTPFEMVQTKWRVKCPLFVARQWMRHRTMSYNEVSRRYTSEEVEFYEPAEWRRQDQRNKQSSDGEHRDSNFYAIRQRQDNQRALHHYQTMIDDGVAREMARMVLPQSIYTTFICSVNLRNLLHFIGLRDDSHAQHEIQVYAAAMRSIMYGIAPVSMEAWGEYRRG